MLSLLLLAAALPNDYGKADAWLCRPGRDDACAVDLTTGVLGPDDRVRPAPPTPAGRSRSDCFYVYPTVSLDPTPNSDMVPGREEQGTTTAQLAPFRDVCRPYAPLYRQVTLTGLRAMLSGAPVPVDREMPYADVRAAWREYLAHDNGGRPFVLIGHSQGSIILRRLIAEEIDGKPVARRMLSAILPGTTIAVPPGQDVGGDFKALRLCRRPGQTSCIVTWASYRDTGPPPANALFGTARPGMIAGCTNPAALGGGAAPLDAIMGFPWWTGGVARYAPPDGWPADAPRFVKTPGLLSGECRTDGPSYLAVHVNRSAAAGVAAAVGPSAVGDTVWPEWGWHVIDMAIVAGDLVRLVAAQGAAWSATTGGGRSDGD